MRIRRRKSGTVPLKPWISSTGRRAAFQGGYAGIRAGISGRGDGAIYVLRRRLVMPRQILGTLQLQVFLRVSFSRLMVPEYLTTPCLSFLYYLIIFSTMESMRTTAPLSITLPPDMLKRAKKLAGKENRTMSELIREALRRYEQATDPAEIRRQAVMEFRRVLADVRKDARRAGTAKLTMPQVDKEIAAGRAERRKRLSLTQSPK